MALYSPRKSIRKSPKSRFRGLNETAETDPAVSLRPRKSWQNFSCRIPQSHWDRGIRHEKLCGPAVNNQKYVNKIENFCHISLSLIETAGFDSAVSLRPRNLWQKCLWPTAEIDPAASLRLRNPIRRSHRDRGIRTLQTIILIFSAKTKPYAKRLLACESGP
jgi:hypothetical protein